MNHHVTCIILNYNEWDVTQKCISSLEHSSHDNFNIILIDNNSPTERNKIVFENKTYQLFDNYYRDNKFENNIEISQTLYSIKSTQNGGFPYGVNIGISIALNNLKSDYVWILNNDTICNTRKINSKVCTAFFTHSYISLRSICRRNRFCINITWCFYIKNNWCCTT